jgi:hypothetical protein
MYIGAAITAVAAITALAWLTMPARVVAQDHTFVLGLAAGLKKLVNSLFSACARFVRPSVRMIYLRPWPILNYP